ncbi:MAG: hypothetical protein ABIF40_01045 [archaeon]
METYQKILGILSLGLLTFSFSACAPTKPLIKTETYKCERKILQVDDYTCELKLDQDTVKLYDTDNQLVAKIEFNMADTLRDGQQEDFNDGLWDVNYYTEEASGRPGPEDDIERERIDDLFLRCINTYLEAEFPE